MPRHRENIPDISVIVTVVDGGETLRTCLEALRNQRGAQRMEVIVPFDRSARAVGAFASDFPEVDFIDLGPVDGGIEPRNSLDQYRLWTLWRTAGIEAAQGRLIGMLHDRGIPAEDWAEAMVTLHREHPAAAVGGCVETGYDTTWHWAVHFYDFAGYMPPQEMVETDALSVTNVCYDAAALNEVRHLFEDGFKELLVHEALSAAGRRLILSDLPRTTEIRPRVPTPDLAGEWFQWGQKYSRTRSAQIDWPRRAVRIAMAPLVPLVLYVRLLRVQREKALYLSKFWKSSPLLMLILSMWALGEMVGYVKGPLPWARS